MCNDLAELAMRFFIDYAWNEGSYSCWYQTIFIQWQTQVENEHYSTVSGLVISLECFIEITPDFLCPFMNACTVNFRATATGSL